MQSVVLRIKPFGSGSIVSKPSGIKCGSGCSHSFQAGTTVVLTANAAPGEKLANWVGCDSSSGSTCTVTLNRNRLLLPTFASTAPLQIKPSTKLLDAATIHAIVNHVGSTYSFAAGTIAASSLQPGDVIVGHGTTSSGTTIGILARVVSVTISADGTIVVTTSPARLTDVIASGTVWYSKPLTQTQLKTATPLVAGVVVKDTSSSCSSQSSTEFAIGLNHVLVGSGKQQVALNGCLKLSFTPDFALNIGLFSGVKEFRSVLVTTSNQSLSLDTTAAVNLTKKTPICCATLTFAAIPIYPLVWITPHITVYLGVKVQADGSVHLAVALQENATGGVEYQQGSGWSPIESFTPSFTAKSHQFKAKMNSTAYVEPNFSLLVDDLAGPFVALKGYLQGVAWAETGGTAALGWNLYGGVQGYAGMEADPLGWNLGKIQYQLFDRRILLANSHTSASPDTVPPTVPLHLVATPVSASEIDLTWDPSTADSAVKGYKIYKGSSYWETVASNFASDTRLGAQTQACYSVEAVDVASNVSGPTETVCATTPPSVDKTPPTTPTGFKVSTMAGDSITLSWNPSTDNVGVRGYRVSRNDAPIAAITQPPYTQYTDTPLAAGTKYCYTVEAFDASGNLSTRSASVCATTTTTTTTGNFAPLQEVTPIDGAAGDGFGASVAIDGTTAVVGAPNKTVKGRSEQGTAYVYTYQNGAWTQSAELTANDGSAYSAFGTSVAISGTTIVVGAQGELTPDEVVLGQQGAVYIFKKRNGIWAQSAKLTAADGGMGDSFGTSVALSGSTLLIGAPYKNSSNGAAYVFTNKTGVWTQSHEVVDKDTYAYDRLGTAVAVSGTTVVVGAPAAGFGSGNVGIGTENSVWVQSAELSSSFGPGGNFGTSVALSGATALVGAPSWLAGGGAVHSYTDAGVGAVYSYTDQQNGIWTQSSWLVLANPSREADAFGASVATSGTTAVIGAPAETLNGQYKQGAAYVYTIHNGILTRSAKLTASNGAANDNFGASVAISSTTELIGAPNTSNGGAAYFFSQ